MIEEYFAITLIDVEQKLTIELLEKTLKPFYTTYLDSGSIFLYDLHLFTKFQLAIEKIDEKNTLIIYPFSKIFSESMDSLIQRLNALFPEIIKNAQILHRKIEINMK